MQKKCVDYSSSVIKMLESRLWQRDGRDIPVVQPDISYFNTWVPDGRRLVTGAYSGEFTLWNAINFSFESILQGHDCPIRSMTWSHNGMWMVTTDDRGFVKYWQSNFNNVHTFQAHSDPVKCSSLSPMDTKLATCSDDGTIRTFDFIQCSEEFILRGHGSDVKWVDWHPRKNMIASGSKDYQQPVKLWDAKNGIGISTLHSHKAAVHCVKWNQNGNWLLTTSKDGLIKAYDIRMMREMFSLKGHKKEVTVAAWHPVHETLFASGGSDGAILFWDIGNDREIGGMESAHEGVVWALSWHPLGHMLASGSNDFTSKFWCRNRPGDEMDKYNSGVHALVISEENVEDNFPVVMSTGIRKLSAITLPPPSTHKDSLPTTWSGGMAQKPQQQLSAGQKGLPQPSSVPLSNISVLGADIIAETFGDLAKKAIPAPTGPPTALFPPKEVVESPKEVGISAPFNAPQSFRPHLLPPPNLPPHLPSPIPPANVPLMGMADNRNFPSPVSQPNTLHSPQLQQHQQQLPSPLEKPGWAQQSRGAEFIWPESRGPPLTPSQAPGNFSNNRQSPYTWQRSNYNQNRRSSYEEERQFQPDAPHHPRPQQQQRLDTSVPPQNPYVYRRTDAEPPSAHQQRDPRVTAGDQRTTAGDPRRAAQVSVLPLIATREGGGGGRGPGAMQQTFPGKEGLSSSGSGPHGPSTSSEERKEYHQNRLFPTQSAMGKQAQRPQEQFGFPSHGAPTTDKLPSPHGSAPPDQGGALHPHRPPRDTQVPPLFRSLSTSHSDQRNPQHFGEHPGAENPGQLANTRYGGPRGPSHADPPDNLVSPQQEGAPHSGPPSQQGTRHQAVATRGPLSDQHQPPQHGRPLEQQAHSGPLDKNMPPHHGGPPLQHPLHHGGGGPLDQKGPPHHAARPDQHEPHRHGGLPDQNTPMHQGRPQGQQVVPRGSNLPDQHESPYLHGRPPNAPPQHGMPPGQQHAPAQHRGGPPDQNEPPQHGGPPGHNAPPHFRGLPDRNAPPHHMGTPGQQQPPHHGERPPDQNVPPHHRGVQGQKQPRPPDQNVPPHRMGTPGQQQPPRHGELLPDKNEPPHHVAPDQHGPPHHHGPPDRRGPPHHRGLLDQHSPHGGPLDKHGPPDRVPLHHGGPPDQHGLHQEGPPNQFGPPHRERHRDMQLPPHPGGPDQHGPPVHHSGAPPNQRPLLPTHHGGPHDHHGGHYGEPLDQHGPIHSVPRGMDQETPRHWNPTEGHQFNTRPDHPSPPHDPRMSSRGKSGMGNAPSQRDEHHFPQYDERGLQDGGTYGDHHGNMQRGGERDGRPLLPIGQNPPGENFFQPPSHPPHMPNTPTLPPQGNFYGSSTPQFPNGPPHPHSMANVNSEHSEFSTERPSQAQQFRGQKYPQQSGFRYHREDNINSRGRGGDRMGRGKEVGGRERGRSDHHTGVEHKSSSVHVTDDKHSHDPRDRSGGKKDGKDGKADKRGKKERSPSKKRGNTEDGPPLKRSRSEKKEKTDKEERSSSAKSSRNKSKKEDASQI